MKNSRGMELATYRGTITDTARWTQYQPRSGDVIVSTPPKSGTTWTLAIVTMLLQGRTDIVPSELAKWYDARLEPVEAINAQLDAQGHRRCIKSHVPFDAIPYYPDAHYIAVYRHPLDVLFSLRKHLLNAKNTPSDNPIIGKIGTMLNAFVSGEMDPEDFDRDTLAMLALHYQTHARAPRPDNLLLLHYADMMRDHPGTVRQIAAHISVEAEDALQAKIVRATEFNSMKAEAERHAPFASLGYWKDNSAFFDAAGAGKWASRISDAQFARYRDRLTAMLPDADCAWPEGGAARP